MTDRNNQNPFSEQDWARDIFAERDNQQGYSDQQNYAGQPGQTGYGEAETSYLYSPQVDRPRQPSYSEQQYAGQQGYAGYAGYPGQPAPTKNNSNPLLYGLIAFLAVLLLAGGATGLYFFANSGDESPKSPDTVAAGDASSSSAEPIPGRTFTETVTNTAPPVPSQGSEPRVQDPSTSNSTAPKGRSGFDMRSNTYGSDYDEKGWLGTSARCGDGDYARVLAETEKGWIVICENSYNRQQKYYIGHFGDISETPDSYSVDSYSTRRIVAVNGEIEYVLTPDSIDVYNADGENIFHDEVVDWGILQAG